jgi:hypothetical protein
MRAIRISPRSLSELDDKKMFDEKMTFRGVEVESHREALGAVLAREGKAEPARRLVFTMMKYAVPAALAALLVLSVFLVINTNTKPGGHQTTDGQKKRAAESTNTAGPSASSSIDMLMAPAEPPEPAATFKNLEDAEKVVHMKILRPGVTHGGRVTQALIGTYSNQEPVIVINYDNGLQITADVCREPVDYAGRIAGLKWNETQMYKNGPPPVAPSYRLIDVRGHQGFTWGKDLEFWENSIEYQLFSLKGGLSLDSLMRIADSMTGKTEVPPPGIKLPLPPNYPDIESARRMSHIDFRAPKNTGGAPVTGVYATTMSQFGRGKAGKDLKSDGKLVTISYSNQMQVGYESPLQTDDRDWVVVRKLEVGSHPAEVVEASGGAPDVAGLVLKWADGEGGYSVSFNGPQSQQADRSGDDIQARIARLQAVAQSMYH